MRGTFGNSTAVLCCNNANSSLTIGVKKENMNKRIGSVQVWKWSASKTRTTYSQTVRLLKNLINDMILMRNWLSYSMKFIQGQDRFQTCLFPVSHDASIDENNEVRLIDLFVDSLNLKFFGFSVDFVDNGRTAYHPKDLLKLYIMDIWRLIWLLF